VAGREHQPERLVEQDPEPQAGRPGPGMAVVLVADDHVERSQPQLGQRLLQLELGDLHPHLRVLGPQPAQDRDQHAAGRRLQAAGPHGAPHLAGQGRQVGPRRLGGGEQHAGVLGEEAAGVSQPHPAAGPLQDAHAGLLLQDGQLLRDRGRGVAEGGGDRGEGAPLGQLAEHAQAAQIHSVTLTIEIR
jgi:hypothetical protein